MERPLDAQLARLTLLKIGFPERLPTRMSQDSTIDIFLAFEGNFLATEDLGRYIYGGYRKPGTLHSPGWQL